ncbi:MAG: hypothetical protein HYT12_04800 [Candidatus Liptonbacteria bacterium]|nr:hypothetical protein [Candidatus Liptonbacteria bacterium]
MKRNRGYIALISSIVIALLLLMVTLTLNYTGFFARYNILFSEYKERSVTLAEACANLALLELANNAGYSGGETISLGTDSCLIRPIISGDPVIIETQAIFQNSYTNLRINADQANLDIVSWEEVPNF